VFAALVQELRDLKKVFSEQSLNMYENKGSMDNRTENIRTFMSNFRTFSAERHASCGQKRLYDACPFIRGEETVQRKRIGCEHQCAYNYAVIIVPQFGATYPGNEVQPDA
jgi:hypothetical protein